MRHLLMLAVLLACGATTRAGAGPISDPASTSILLHLHPRPWHPPTALAPVGLRTDVDPGGDGLADPMDGAFAAMREARARALANVRVELRPDGSAHAVVGGLLRAYAVARLGPEGRLVEDCTHSEAEALEWLVGPTQPAPAKEGK